MRTKPSAIREVARKLLSVRLKSTLLYLQEALYGTLFRVQAMYE